jgi:hypothetical protein
VKIRRNRKKQNSKGGYSCGTARQRVVINDKLHVASALRNKLKSSPLYDSQTVGQSSRRGDHLPLQSVRLNRSTCGSQVSQGECHRKSSGQVERGRYAHTKAQLTIWWGCEQCEEGEEDLKVRS